MGQSKLPTILYANQNIMEQFIQEIARGAGHILKENFRKVGVKYTKTHAMDVVTEADLLSNTYIVDAIKKQYPDHGILSEETGEEVTQSPYQWIIDPLDGTFNFATSIPIFGVIIGLAKNNVVEMGCIYDPMQDELFYAKRGAGAFLNGKQISCSQKSEIPDSAGLYSANQGPQKFTLSKRVIEMGEQERLVINSWGCHAFSLAQVASGRRDWCLSPSAGTWDYAAGSLILSEAGCNVTNLEGKPWSITDKNMLAANPILHEKIFHFLKTK